MHGDTSIRMANALERLKAGEDSARSELLNLASERISRLARKMFYAEQKLASIEESCDIAQTASLKLWQRLEHTVPNDIRHFFRLAAQNIRWVLIDLARKWYGPHGAGVHEVNPHSAEGNTVIWEPRAKQSSYDAGRLAMWTELHEQIDKMPEDEKELADYLYYSGLTQSETARLTGISTKTIRERWKRIRLKLHQVLHDH